MELIPEHLILRKTLKNCCYLTPNERRVLLIILTYSAHLTFLLYKWLTSEFTPAHELGVSVSCARLSLKLKNKVGTACSGLENHGKNAVPQSFEPSPLSLPKSVPIMTNFLSNLQAAILTTSGRMLILFVFK